MKLAKLSLAAIVVAGLASSSFAESTTLADAFKNGKVNGELRAWYFNRDNGTATENIFNTGVDLTYVTDSLYGLSLGLTMQSNYSPFANNAEKTMYTSDMYGSGAVLSEAYIQYQIGKTTAKVGRQYIATPLVNGSGSRMIKEAFEGAVIVNTDIPSTTLFGGYADKFQGRTTNIDKTLTDKTASDIGEFKKTAVFYGAGTTAGSNVFGFDGAYTMGAINNSISNLTLTAQYLYVNDVSKLDGTVLGDANGFYGEGNYVLPLSNMKVILDAGYRGSRTTSVLDTAHLEGDMFQARVGFKELAGFGASFAYSTVSSDQSVLLGAGNGPTTYTAPLIKAAEVTSGANTDAYKVEATYDFSKVGVVGLKVLGQYVYVDQDAVTGTVFNGVAAKTKNKFWEGQVSYDIPNLKGLTLSLEYENATKEVANADVDSNEMRFRANYKF
ncbi:outer membrane porin, OprD family [Sulfurospirillum diekertiae]|uniref:Outer membrane porin, OprD family n=1 Tax=Sulfurospirillum diekertiae TaxID=1854492 RepID=A0A6G9VSL3_9BACT|nr:OprD family outer membrane porin [Sulfurospirillum diekertiae]QIR76526.1 outer membrane porin, OprD family [Sulfurospirillum diekertiae]QIR79155.1 outer membrane porin, OprD family [Sulfurospirillum diekertiae]